VLFTQHSLLTHFRCVLSRKAANTSSVVNGGLLGGPTAKHPMNVQIGNVLAHIKLLLYHNILWVNALPHIRLERTH